jgi:hypothetical protein
MRSASRGPNDHYSKLSANDGIGASSKASGVPRKLDLTIRV